MNGYGIGAWIRSPLVGEKLWAGTPLNAKEVKMHGSMILLKQAKYTLNMTLGRYSFLVHSA
jgi:hypothetical protein